MRRFLALLERIGVKPIDMNVSDVINVVKSYIKSTAKSMPTLVSGDGDDVLLILISCV